MFRRIHTLVPIIVGLMYSEQFGALGVHSLSIFTSSTIHFTNSSLSIGCIRIHKNKYNTNYVHMHAYMHAHMHTNNTCTTHMYVMYVKTTYVYDALIVCIHT